MVSSKTLSLFGFVIYRFDDVTSQNELKREIGCNSDKFSRFLKSQTVES